MDLSRESIRRLVIRTIKNGPLCEGRNFFSFLETVTLLATFLCNVNEEKVEEMELILDL